MKATYLTISGEIVSETRNGVVSDYIPDSLGSTSKIVNLSMTVTDRFVYWPYGELQSHVGSSPTSFTFGGTLGYYTDSYGSIYIRAREFNPTITAWMSPDPSWPFQLPFVYGLANPISLVDLDGTSPGPPSLQCYPPRSECSCYKGGGNVSSSSSRVSNVKTVTFTGVSVTITASGSVTVSGSVGVVTGSGTVSGSFAGTYSCEVVQTTGDVISRKCTWDCRCHGCLACPDEGYCRWVKTSDLLCKGTFEKQVVVCPGVPQFIVVNTFTPFPDQPLPCK
jgi:RHS repeat-associated protein